MAELSLSILVQPRSMSWLLQRHGRVSDFDLGCLGSIPAEAKVFSIFSPVTFGAQCK